MSTEVLIAPAALQQNTASFPMPPTDLPSEDGIPLESDWHRQAINLLIDSIHMHWLGRTDFYAGGNMFIYFSTEQARNRDFRGPDFFLVKGVVGTHMRDYWAIWDEGGKYPDVVVELMSPTTRKEDLGRKKDIYENVFHVQEYYCYDPATMDFIGWRMVDRKFVTIEPDAAGRLESREMQAFLGVGEGTNLGRTCPWLRLFDSEGKVVPTFAEAERRKAAAEKRRADELEAEVARLKAQLQQGGS